MRCVCACVRACLLAYVRDGKRTYPCCVRCTQFSNPGGAPETLEPRLFVAPAPEGVVRRTINRCKPNTVSKKYHTLRHKFANDVRCSTPPSHNRKSRDGRTPRVGLQRSGQNAAVTLQRKRGERNAYRAPTDSTCLLYTSPSPRDRG